MHSVITSTSASTSTIITTYTYSYPKLVPLINAAADINTPVIDIFSAMGGTPDWKTAFPPMCSLQTAQS